MMTFRHIMTILFYSLFFLLIIFTLMFITFPLDNYLLLLTKKILNLPFILFVLLVTIIMSIIIGIIIANFWQSRLKRIKENLQSISRGQTPNIDNSFKEITSIEEEIKKIDQKLKQQIEHTQKLATERAEEREASLHEVVIQERNRLARDLHDSVSQQLFAASMMMSAINEANYNVNNSLYQQLQMIEKMLQDSQLEMRALLLHLRPIALKGKSIQSGINELIDELMNRLPIKVDRNIEQFEVEKGIEDQLFRILQEALANALRHANASSIQITFIKRDHFVILKVNDDGKGFDLASAKTGSYGLANMQERANDLGGTLKIISILEQGTSIEVKIPII